MGSRRKAADGLHHLQRGLRWKGSCRGLVLLHANLLPLLLPFLEGEGEQTEERKCGDGNTIVSRFGVPPPCESESLPLPTPPILPLSLCEIESLPIPILPSPGRTVNQSSPPPSRFIWPNLLTNSQSSLIRPPPPSAHPLREGENLDPPLQILPPPRARARPYRPYPPLQSLTPLREGETLRPSQDPPPPPCMVLRTD